jgi:hypothetical protein
MKTKAQRRTGKRVRITVATLSATLLNLERRSSDAENRTRRETIKRINDALKDMPLRSVSSFEKILKGMKVS